MLFKFEINNFFGNFEMIGKLKIVLWFIFFVDSWNLYRMSGIVVVELLSSFFYLR